ncbi:MOSC domain-containing protein [Paenibacillus pinistramenti]|uniref:MOSC domain-containing protein n=1 Tax=Paenibacillus pinistramenti TaxID=1768003 RepID=UPI001EF0365A|nr:MOSC N-terminal beta barrel domain-containing protein [Paenibacillus pinistramenti]
MHDTAGKVTHNHVKVTHNHVKVGTIREISRYPVKSLGGETLDMCEIESYGLQGDRICSFRDETKQGWGQFVTARNTPAMLNYKASFQEDRGIRVTAPDGRIMGWDEELLQEIQGMVKKPISMSRLMEPHPEAEHSSLLSVDGASVLLVTDASLRKLEQLWGKPVDQRRFRGNFVIDLNDDSLFEGDWIGRQLDIGGARLQVDSFCERCVFITIDPDSQEKDPSLLRKVYEDFGLHFGVYASVVRTGTVRTGDEVTLVGQA